MAIPQSAVNGDRAELTIEADGRRISHANPAILNPVTVRYRRPSKCVLRGFEPAVFSGYDSGEPPARPRHYDFPP